MIDDKRGNARSLSARQALHPWDVRQNEHDLGGIIGGGGCVDQGLDIGAPTGDEHTDALPLAHGAASPKVPLYRTRSPRPRLTMAPITNASSPRWRSTRFTSRGAVTKIMPMPQLKVRSISA